MNVSEISSESKDYRQIKVVIGGDGHSYKGTDNHFEVTSSISYPGLVYLLLPDSVGEYYRQQGRRQLQSEMRALLNASRAQ